MKKAILFVTLLVCALALQPEALSADTEGIFKGTLSGNVSGSGKVTGPVLLTIKDKAVTGHFSGKSVTGDPFTGKITGSFDVESGTINATYSGSFDRILGGKSIGAVPMSGPFKGTLNGSTFAGSWGGKASGSWSASGELATVDVGPEKFKGEASLANPLTSTDGLEVASDEASDISVVTNTSKELRAIAVDVPNGTMSIYAMPGSSFGIRGGIRLPNVKNSQRKTSQMPGIILNGKSPPAVRQSERGQQVTSGSKAMPTELRVLMTRAGAEQDQSTFEAAQLNQAILQLTETEFVLLDEGAASSIKMIEGQAIFTSRTTDESVTISAGETVTATAKGLGKVEKFDIATEEARWNNAVEKAVPAQREKKSWFGCTLVP